MNGARKVVRTKHVVIQKKIDESMKEEFEKLLAESKKNKLLQYVIEGKISSMDLQKIKDTLTED